MVFELVKFYRVFKILRDKKLSLSILRRGKIGLKLESIDSVCIRKMIYCSFGEDGEMKGF